MSSEESALIGEISVWRSGSPACQRSIWDVFVESFWTLFEKIFTGEENSWDRIFQDGIFAPTSLCSSIIPMDVCGKKKKKKNGVLCFSDGFGTNFCENTTDFSRGNFMGFQTTKFLSECDWNKRKWLRFRCCLKALNVYPTSFSLVNTRTQIRRDTRCGLSPAYEPHTVQSALKGKEFILVRQNSCRVHRSARSVHRFLQFMDCSSRSESSKEDQPRHQ